MISKKQNAKLAAVERFKRELVKDKGKLRQEIEEQKKGLALRIKAEHEKNLFKIVSTKQKERAVNGKKREAVTRTEILMQESVKNARKKRAEEIRAAQEREYMEVMKKLRAKRQGLAHMQARWKDEEVTVGDSQALPTRSCDGLFQPEPEQVRSVKGKLSCSNLRRMKQSPSTTADPRDEFN